MSKIASKICQNSEFDEIRALLAPYTKRAYLVGGYVRDLLLGRECSDYDVEIYDVSPQNFDALMQKIGANCVGKSYFIYKFKNFDLGLPRTESKTGKRHRDFSVKYCNDEREASMRRDFTINAMMINIFNGSLVDCWGGERDLALGVLRHVDNDKFCEDALRVLRGIQFAARLNFAIAPQTIKLMKTLNLGFLSRDRIAAELVKFMRAPRLDVGVEYLYKLDLLKPFFGLDLSERELKNFKRELKNARKFIADERLFLYLASQKFGANVDKIVFDLALPKSFLSVKKQPVCAGEPSLRRLLEISLEMPLNSWLGCYNEGRIKVAKELNIYERKFSPAINASEILAQGFTGAAIGEQIRARQNAAIDEFLKTRSAARKFKPNSGKIKP